MHKRIPEILSTSAIAFGLATAPVLAQQAPAAKPQAPVTAPSQNYSDAQLQKFVGASQKVAVISEQYRPQLQAAKDDTARGEIYQEADDKMVAAVRSEEHTSELQSLMRISYAVFCLKKKKKQII